jgi:uncharacterized protein YkwD
MRGSSIERMRFIAFTVALACVAGSAAAAVPPAEDGRLLAAATHWREQGCRGNAGTRAPLHWSRAVSRAAAHIAAGENALPALEHQGYRATRVFHSSVAGYRSAADVAYALSQHYCADLVDPRFTDIGLHHEGSQWTIVLAARFQLPQLAEPRMAGQRVLALVNAARSHERRCGNRPFGPAAPLRWNERLAQAAVQHAQDMASHAVLDHRGHDGSTPPQRVARTGYAWRSVGENVAAGQPSPDEVVADWLSSPGHCANIMEPAFTDMAVAFAVDMKSQPAVYWAQEFARPR